jgi:hypothetical protein
MSSAIVMNNAGSDLSSSERLFAASSMILGLSLKSSADEIVDTCNDRASAVIVFGYRMVGPAKGHIISRQRENTRVTSGGMLI